MLHYIRRKIKRKQQTLIPMSSKLHTRRGFKSVSQCNVSMLIDTSFHEGVFVDFVHGNESELRVE